MTLKISAPGVGAFDVFEPDVYLLMCSVFLAGPESQNLGMATSPFFHISGKYG